MDIYSLREKEKNNRCRMSIEYLNYDIGFDNMNLPNIEDLNK